MIIDGLKRLTGFFLLVFFLTTPAWSQERAARPAKEFVARQALVIGNANYAHAGVLRNPANDAKAIGRTLEQLGFKVITLTDADERQMDQAIRNFGRRLEDKFILADELPVPLTDEGKSEMFDLE